MRKNRHKHKKSSRNFRSQRSIKSSYLIKRLKYFPAIIITLFASFIWSQPNFVLLGKDRGVLAYATDVSPAGLLAATNARRAANSKAGLSMNAQLANAAQSKANDMVTRDYWSHETPDGQQPWVFVTNAGYQYLSAGENLAYGFSTSNGTVTGWMNSPPHKANLLSDNFTEVGFGIANSPNYVGNGKQTVVVAMYGRPQVLAAAPSAPAPVQPTPPKPVETKPAETPSETPITKTAIEESQPKPSEEPIAVSNTGDINKTAGTAEVQRVQVLTGGSAMWSATFVILGVCAIGFLWLMHRGFRFKKWLKSTEKFIGKHLYFDLTVLSIIFLGFVLLSTSGTIR